jgi:hypothetical protein
MNNSGELRGNFVPEIANSELVFTDFLSLAQPVAL